MTRKYTNPAPELETIICDYRGCGRVIPADAGDTVSRFTHKRFVREIDGRSQWEHEYYDLCPECAERVVVEINREFVSRNQARS